VARPNTADPARLKTVDPASVSGGVFRPRPDAPKFVTSARLRNDLASAVSDMDKMAQSRAKRFADAQASDDGGIGASPQ
jgi:hypothetical protein